MVHHTIQHSPLGYWCSYCSGNTIFDDLESYKKHLPDHSASHHRQVTKCFSCSDDYESVQDYCEHLVWCTWDRMHRAGVQSYESLHHWSNFDEHYQEIEEAKTGTRTEFCRILLL